MIEEGPGRWNLLLRKCAITGLAALGAALVPVLTAVLESESFGWNEATLSLLGAGVLGALFRAGIATISAFVPTDALTGANVMGQYRHTEVVASSPPTQVAEDASR